MSKEEYVELIKSLEVVFNEGIQSDTNTNVFPRIVFWEYEWEPLIASGQKFNTNVAYQTSFFSKTPRHQKLLDLISKLAEKNIHVHVYHEYIQAEKYFHSYFALEVLENV